MVKVVKFGGSSLASAEQFAKVGDIIRADESRKYVVPSAPGKRNSRDTKVTDMLYACYAKAEAGEEFRVPLMKIKERYDSIINGLGLKVTLDEEFKTISKNFKEKAGVDYAASRGEYLNGILMADYLGYEFIDSATVIFFDEEGNTNTGIVLYAEKDGEIIAVAGAARETNEIMEVGIDVKKSYRGQGLAKLLVHNLSVEILKRNKIPFYSASVTNLASQSVAVRSGYKLLWTDSYGVR